MSVRPAPSLRVRDPLCPCGCGIIVDPPINVHSVWHSDRPYWAWMCSNPACDRFQVEQKNQSGDRECPWCHRDRDFIGHFKAQEGGGQQYRISVTGEKVVRPPRAEAHYWNPAKVLDWQGEE